MHSITDILNILLKAIFVGFGFVIPILALIKTSNLKALEVKDLFIITSVQAIRVSGIIYFILALVAVYPFFTNSGDVGGVNVDFTGYALNLLFTPFMYLLLTQLFWIKKLYMKKAALISLAILMLILPHVKFLSGVKTFGSESLAAVLSIFSVANLTFWALNIIVFIFIIFTIILLGGKLKDKKV